jgi:type IV pilus assembly protein PilY1
LTQRSLTVAGVNNGRLVRGFEAEAPLPATSKGWFVDLVPPPPPVGAVEGERVVTEGQIVGSQLIFASVIPTAESCEPNGRGYINALNAFTGTSSSQSFFDINSDGVFGNDEVGGVPVGSVDLGVGMPTLPALLRGLIVVSGSSGGVGSTPTDEPRNVSRVSWREVVGD